MRFISSLLLLFCASTHSFAQKQATTLPTSGSGFLVSGYGFILTSWQLVGNAKHIYVRGASGNHTDKFAARVVAHDRGNDLALIQLENKDIRFDNVPYAIRTSTVQTEEPVYVIGYIPASDEPQFAAGEVTSRVGHNDDVATYRATIEAGSIGAPVFDSTGNVIGMCTSYTDDKPHPGVAKAVYISTFVQLIALPTSFAPDNTLGALPVTIQVTTIAPYVYNIEAER
jgi:S1-C subfamily serine protease